MNAQLIQKAIVEDAWYLLNLARNQDDDPEYDETHHHHRSWWWEPTTTTTGWTVVHFAAAHFVPIEWWQWIVGRASRSDPAAFYQQRTGLGETVLDIFFTTFLNPLPWQSLKVKNRSELFRKGLPLVMRLSRMLKRVRKLICSDWTKTFVVDETNEFAFERSISILSSPDYRVANFLIHLKFLCLASIHRTESKQPNRFLTWDNDDNDDEQWIFQMLSTGVQCPKIVAELLSRVFPNVLTRIQVNPQPLHEWCCFQTVERTDDEPNGLVEVLLHACPELAMHQNPLTGRLPLEEALTSGKKSWKQVAPFLTAAPNVLRDYRYQKLPIFAWAAVAATRTADDVITNDTVVSIMARRSVVGDSGLVSLWCLATPSVKENAITKAQRDYDCERLTTIFEALIACPPALMDTAQ